MLGSPALPPKIRAQSLAFHNEPKGFNLIRPMRHPGLNSVFDTDKMLASGEALYVLS